LITRAFNSRFSELLFMVRLDAIEWLSPVVEMESISSQGKSTAWFNRYDV